MTSFRLPHFRPGASAANRGRRVPRWITAATTAQQCADTLARAGDAEGEAIWRRQAETWTQLAAQEAKWAAHYAGQALARRGA